MKKAYNFLLILSSFLFFAGTCNEEAELMTSTECATHGRVVDYTGLDGCGLIIETEAGLKLEPAELPDNAELIAGSRIAFDYEILEDRASICMVGPIVKITCLEVIESSEPDCPDFQYVSLDQMDSPDFKLIDYEIRGSQLKLKVSFSGCNTDRDFKLLLNATSVNNRPARMNASLSFTPQLCKAYFTKELCFDLSQLEQETIINLRQGTEIIELHFKP